MTACANCARELRPEWRFCVSCGMPTGVTARPDAAPVVTPEMSGVIATAALPEPASASAPLPETSRFSGVLVDPNDRTPEPPGGHAGSSGETKIRPRAVEGLATRPGPEPVLAPLAGSVAEVAGAPAPTLLLAPPEPEPVIRSTSVRTRSRSRSRERRSRRVNALAIVALVLGCLASPLAALFGHLALVQIAAGRQRGRIPAIIAIVLGYSSLAFVVGLGVVYLTTRG